MWFTFIRGSSILRPIDIANIKYQRDAIGTLTNHAERGEREKGERKTEEWKEKSKKMIKGGR